MAILNQIGKLRLADIESDLEFEAPTTAEYVGGVDMHWGGFEVYEHDVAGVALVGVDFEFLPELVAAESLKTFRSNLHPELLEHEPHDALFNVIFNTVGEMGRWGEGIDFKFELLEEDVGEEGFVVDVDPFVGGIGEVFDDWGDSAITDSVLWH